MDRNFFDGYLEWQSDPEITGINKLPQHATLMPYANFEEAAACERYKSSNCKLLNGKWKFKLYKNYAYKPTDFAQPHYDSHNWDSIQVPGSWTMQGYDRNQYCNVRYLGRAVRISARPAHPQKIIPWAVILKEYI